MCEGWRRGKLTTGGRSGGINGQLGAMGGKLKYKNDSEVRHFRLGLAKKKR